MVRINIIVTNRCNMNVLPRAEDSLGNCAFCFRPVEEIHTSKEIFDAILEKINAIEDTVVITFTGGEPLLDSNIDYMVKRTFEKGYFTALHSNGILLDKMSEKILPYINCLGVPYDSCKPEMADYHRGKGYYEIQKRAIALAQKYNVEIGFHTLLSRLNISELSEMAEKVSDIPYRYWYIKKFKKINYALNQINEEYYLDNKKYIKAILGVTKKYPEKKIYGIKNIGKNVVKVYMHANGDTYDYNVGDERNRYLGNILTDSWNDILYRHSN